MRDKQDWKDDSLVFLQFFIVVMLGLLFHDYLTNNPTIAELLMPADFALLVISFIPFIAAFLFIRWLNREKI